MAMATRKPTTYHCPAMRINMRNLRQGAVGNRLQHDHVDCVHAHLARWEDTVSRHA